MNERELQQGIERLVESARPSREDALPFVEALLRALEAGSVRAARPCGEDWEVQAWVKAGILLAFRVGIDVASAASPFAFRDRDTLPTVAPPDGVRIVPGGTTVRRGAHVARGVVIMPPAYVNVGAWIGEGTMVDSHALVGSCAQVGSRVHLSAAAQIGGVLEPIGALPVIVEDDAFVGGGAGIYEGTRVGREAVIAAGVVLTRSIAVHDLVAGRSLRATADRPLVIPPRAVVVPGARPASGDYAREHGLMLQAPMIVKYRDAGSAAALALEEALR